MTISTLKYHATNTKMDGNGIKSDSTKENGNNGRNEENLDHCVRIFSECEYKGESYPVCDNISDLRKKGWFLPIRAIKIPSGKSI